VKNLFSIAVICTLMIVAGCEMNRTPLPSLPDAARGAAGAGELPAPAPPQIDSASNGGSSLMAAAPYAGDGKGTVQQNINPVPFLQTSVPMKSGMSMPASAAETLVSRADGTMFGPTDLPPAGAGPMIETVASGASTSNQSTRAASATSTAGSTIPAKQTNKGTTPK
jgi:hypothetical protein